MSEIYQLPENGNNNGNATSHFPFQSALAVMVMDLVMDLAVSTALRICSDFIHPRRIDASSRYENRTTLLLREFSI